MKMFDIQGWEKKRKATVRAFICESLLLGMAYSVIFLTLWVYITTLVKTDRPKTFYALISSAYLLSAIFFSVIVGRWVDKTRNVRLTFLVCNCFVIIGNLVYVVHHSPWFLVVGRLLVGVGGPLHSVVSGEIARCFPSDEQTRKFSANALAFSSGFLIGPGINFFFKDVNIEVSTFHITGANMCGIYMAVLFLIAQAYVLFAVHDLSKEYDLKACETLQNELDGKIKKKRHQDEKTTKEVEKQYFDSKSGNLYMTSLHNYSSETNDNIEVQFNKENQNCIFMKSEASRCSAIDDEMDESETPLLQTKQIKVSPIPQVSSILLQNIKNFDVVLVFVLTFAMYFWMVAFDMWLPMMVIDVLHMSVAKLNYIVFGSGCISALVFVLFICYQFSDKALFTWSLACMLSLALMEAIFASMKLVPTKYYVNIILWVIWASLYAVVAMIDEIFLLAILAKMTASSIQTFNESLRLSIGRLGSLSALLTSAMLFEYFEYMCLGGIIFSILAFVVLLFRRKTFRHPKLIIR